MEAQGSTTGPRYCYRHPDRETGLACSECDRPICYECMTPAAVGLRCPEHSGKPQGIRKVTVAAERTVTGSHARRVNAVTMTLIGINLLVYAAELAGGGEISGVGSWLYRQGALLANGYYGPENSLIGLPEAAVPTYQQQFEIVGVAHGEAWRLLSSAFLHYGPLHLALNMYVLWWAGSFLEEAIGRWRFLLLYLVSGLAGAAGALVQLPNAPTVGASGAIFGVLGALFVLERRGSISTGGQIAGLIVLNLVITFAYSSFISVGGHVGGLIGGVVVMLAFLKFRYSLALTLLSAAGIAAASLFIAYSSI